MKADIKALITITNKDCVYTGYRPAHQIDGYLTTGLHDYPHSLKFGDKTSFQEGATVVG